jgi:hypothetical protein
MDTILKDCRCGKKLRKDEAPFIGAASTFLWFNCPFCKSTFVVLTDSPEGKAFIDYMMILTKCLKPENTRALSCP